MDILILGGTRFVGRHIAEAALRRGDRVTLLHRGRTNPNLFPEAEHLLADRDGGLDVLAGRTWDAAIDVNGYLPRVVRASAQALAGAVRQYMFVSTISVYEDLSEAHEGSAVGTLDDPTTEEIIGATYGPLKVLCEQAVRDAFPDAHLVARAGFIVGPYDYTARYPWLLRRLLAGGEHLAGPAEQPVQLIDARDIADWLLAGISGEPVTGTFNVTGPTTTIGHLLAASADAARANVTFVHADDAFLGAHEVRPIEDVTYWLPPDAHGAMRVDVSAARAAGLTFRPIADTAAAATDWLRATPDAGQLPPDGGGLTPEREAALLAAWRAQHETPA